MNQADEAKIAAEEQLETAHALMQVSLKESFPSTEDELPNGWLWVKLDDVSTIVTGNTPKKSNSSYYGGDVPWVNPSQLGVKKTVYDSEEHLSDLGAKQARMIPPGSVMLACISGSIGHIGKSSITGTALCTNQQINSLVPSDDIGSNFLYYACQARRPALQSLVSSTNQTIVNKATLGNLYIPLPAMAKQIEIEERLNLIESLEDAQQCQINDIGSLQSSLLRKAFAGEL